jgi:hypothetical protein
MKPKVKHRFLEACGIQSETACWEDKTSQNGISSQGRDIGHLFKKHRGDEYKITSVLSEKQPS